MTAKINRVFIVDDDEAVRDSLKWLLESNGFEVQLFESGEDFLTRWTETAGCLVVDVRMPSMSGIELHEALLARDVQLPLVFITGHGDVPMAVNRMKRGAIDFLQKPFNDGELCSTVQRALDTLAAETEGLLASHQRNEALARLTTREHQVLERIVAGRLNKQIADDLSISIKTVEAHRANIMDKLEVRTIAALMKIALGSTGAGTVT
jgi:two-component system, LuxR family, response regulator TtrR